MMSTGDLKGCLRKLDAQLRALKYPREVDYNGLSKGDPSAFLPIVSYVFISYSPHLAEHLVGFGVELTGKNDLRFIECIYKVLRDLFHYKPVLTKQQFLQFGYAERKTCILCDVIAFALQKHKELSKGNKPKPRARFQASSSDSKSEALPFQAETMNPMLSLSRPLVERHIGGDSWVSSSRTSDNEESEEEGLGLEEVQNQAPTVPQADLVAEGRLAALEAQLPQIQTRLGRLSALEQRLQLLEKASAGRITIDKHHWKNLESRVLLLETRLTLSTAMAQESSSLINGGWSHHMADNATEVTESRPSPPESLLHNSGCERPQSSTPSASYPISPCVTTAPPEENMKKRLERIANMMKDTSSLLRSIEPSM
ncbi:centrosomal protein of 44 kDa [Oncorhynchus tshawytscha]|uniref:Centrosomal protein of 44 kDa n=1 Tax=Oncorhynchus tshawytscha TaxID=74940 RepID=A0A8C8CY83_ONCTS|nr:centrosomal protein of 44 kDa [Oncorhynchus tshawytscha]XP_024254588.1 centrosomal protein of 44 kDa [Oncorhynchus tshawytscha]XP_024254589.1 centrosomal protein of 44 kDa [Oncorhynchus tshawytscha]XP_042167748.1 centrosomal protein of 44 kDa [Oncorhynchus tshawytscha]